MSVYAGQVTPVRIPSDRRNKKEVPCNAHEHAQYRSLVGQLLWLSRNGILELCAAVTILSGKLDKPCVQDLMDANTQCRRARQLADVKSTWRPIPLEDGCFVGVSDASWATLPGDRSAGGHMVLFADARILKTSPGMPGTFGAAEVREAVQKAEISSPQPFSLLLYKSGRIKRVCRSTLASETFSLSESSASAQWCRSLMTELTSGSVRSGKPPVWDISLTVDAKAVFDHLSADKATSSSDRRVSVKLNLLRQEMSEERIGLRWIPTKQMLADGLTKTFNPGAVELSYLRQVLDRGEWTLGPDPTAPYDNRGRALVDEWLQTAGNGGAEKKEEAADPSDVAFVCAWLVQNKSRTRRSQRQPRQQQRPLECAVVHIE
jgi:hypothetical protein